MPDEGTMPDVGALIAERRRYEGWLAGLEARRDGTPAHVYTRVESDYRSRLDRVTRLLASHRGALEAELRGYESSLALLDGEERIAADERAEIELRLQVGELLEDEVSESLRAIDTKLEGLARDREQLHANAQRAREYLGLAVDPAEPTGAVAADAPPSAGEAAGDESPAPDAPTATPISGRSVDTPGSGVAATNFDEIGFLSAVVGDHSTEMTVGVASASGEIVKEEESGRSAIDGIGAGTEAPLAGNVASNTPIKLRASGQIEQAKTLQCVECRSMNYPTEWYCERCGAELAAL